MSWVLIYCQDVSHEAKRAKVAEFCKSCLACDILECASQGGERPHLQEWGMQGGNPGLETPDPRNQTRGLRMLPADELLYASGGEVEYQESDVVRRYRLECPLCGLNVTVSEATLPPILTTIADAGVSDVSLGALAARVVGK